MCKDGRCPSCCFMNVSEGFSLWERTEAQPNPYLYYTTKIYLQMTSNTCLKTTKQRSIKQYENSSYWLHWSSIIHVILKVACYVKTWVVTIHGPYLKFQTVSYSHIPMLMRHILRSLFYESGSFAMFVQGAAVWEVLRTFMPCFLLLQFKGFFVLFSCHKQNRKYESNKSSKKLKNKSQRSLTEIPHFDKYLSYLWEGKEKIK